MSMVRVLWVMASLVVLFGAVGCESSKETVAPKKAEVTGLVKVSAAGETFEPPVQSSQIPDGAWYCDMGTVHYARTEKGDETCPLCKMKLKHKTHAAK